MTLKTTIEHLITASEKTGNAQMISLQRGLLLSIQVTPHKTQLRLWRTTARPSIAEWRTVLNAWPYRVRLDEPAEIDERGLRGLSGSWQTPPQPAQLSLEESTS